MHLIGCVSINLLFRGKHDCLGRRLLWPFLFLELSIKLQRLYHFDSRSLRNPKERKCEDQREVGLSVLSFRLVDRRFVEWLPSEELHSKWNWPTTRMLFFSPSAKGKSRVTPSFFTRVTQTPVASKTQFRRCCWETSGLLPATLLPPSQGLRRQFDRLSVEAQRSWFSVLRAEPPLSLIRCWRRCGDSETSSALFFLFKWKRKLSWGEASPVRSDSEWFVLICWSD